MFPRFLTLLFGTIRVMSEAIGNEIAVVITPHKIKLKFIDPDSTDYAWDESLFTSGNLFLEGFANPVKPKIPDNEDKAESEYNLELIESKRYKKLMDNKLMDDVISEGLGDKFPTLAHVLVLSAAMHLVTIVTVAYLLI